MKWTTNDGRVLDVKDMETSHIRNCIEMLKQQMEKADEYDDVICGDHWSLGCMTVPGKETFKKIINGFEKELLSRI